MPTRQEIEAELLAGQGTAGIEPLNFVQRQLLGHLLNQAALPDTPFPQPYMDGLVACYRAALAKQPAQQEMSAEVGQGTAATGAPAHRGAPIPSPPRTWLLSHIEAENFGGLNVLGGAPLVMDVGPEGLCVEGFNGKGKTSLASAILWCLTGHRLNSQDGPTKTGNIPQPLYPPSAPLESELPRPLRQWPPVISYPYGRTAEDIADLRSSATVALTFADPDGNEVVVRRRLSDDGTMEAPDFRPLNIDDVLIELATLMPNRIPFISVGQDDSVITALVKLLGLEPLGQLGDHVAKLIDGRYNFMKNPSAKEIDSCRKDISDARALAERELKGVDGAPDIKAALEGKKGLEWAEAVEGEAAVLGHKAAEMLTAIDGVVDYQLSLDDAGDRRKLSEAMARLKGTVRADILPAHRSLALLEELHATSPSLQSCRLQLPDLVAKHAKAVAVHQRQSADSRLRLKALACRTHVAEHGDTPIAACPLCNHPLRDEAGVALAKELDELRNEAHLIEQAFADTCRALLEKLANTVPKSLEAYRDVDLGSDPGAIACSALKDSLANNTDLKLVTGKTLPAITASFDTLLAALPVFTPPSGVCLVNADGDETLRKAFARVSYLLAWADWWRDARDAVASAWASVAGRHDEKNTILGALAAVSSAIDKARPYESASTHLANAAKHARTFVAMQTERNLKDAIKDALQPLKNLRAYVATEAETALRSVSARAKDIFEEIYDAPFFSSPQAVRGAKSSMAVLGAFNGLRADARHVANASWLRAFLWSFTLAFRESAIAPTWLEQPLSSSGR